MILRLNAPQCSSLYLITSAVKLSNVLEVYFETRPRLSRWHEVCPAYIAIYAPSASCLAAGKCGGGGAVRAGPALSSSRKLAGPGEEEEVEEEEEEAGEEEEEEEEGEVGGG